MRRGRLRAGLTAGVLGVLVLAGGCTGGDGEPAPPRAQASPTGATSPSGQGSAGGGTLTARPEPVVEGKDAGATGPRRVPPGAQRGGVLTIRTHQVPRTLDPTSAYFDSLSILNLVTRSLTQYAYDPASRGMVLVPDMATDLGRPNDDATAWTFTLKKGLRYEDGTPVRAADVAYAVKRSFAQQQLPGGPRYNQVFFAGGQGYDGPFTDGLDYRGVSVSGRDVTIRMRRPFAEMDYYASFPQFTAIPRSADDPQDPLAYGEHPLATGPYRVFAYEPGRTLTLVSNDEWDPATDPGRIQAVDSWRFELGRSVSAVETPLLDDGPEGATSATYDNLSASTRETLRKQAPARLLTGPTGCTYLWAIDERKVTDPRVRRALGYAFPYADFWRASGETPGVTRLAGTSLLPPGTAGRVDYDPLGIDGRRTDAERARALLDLAGERGYDVRFYFESNDPASVAAKDVIVEALRAAGFAPRPVPTTLADRTADESDPGAPVNVRASGFCSDWPTGGSWFPAYFDSGLIEKGAQDDPNPSFLSARPVDRAIERILDQVPPGRAATAWGELDQRIASEYYPVVNLGYSGVATARGSRVGGFHLDRFHGMPTFADMYLTKPR